MISLGALLFYEGKGQVDLRERGWDGGDTGRKGGRGNFSWYAIYERRVNNFKKESAFNYMYLIGKKEIGEFFFSVLSLIKMIIFRKFSLIFTQ